MNEKKISWTQQNMLGDREGDLNIFCMHCSCTCLGLNDHKTDGSNVQKVVFSTKSSSSWKCGLEPLNWEI